jgi:hypothetical protein
MALGVVLVTGLIATLVIAEAQAADDRDKGKQGDLRSGERRLQQQEQSTTLSGKNGDDFNDVCCSSKDNKISSGGGDDFNIAREAGRDNKISSGGGDETNIAGAEGGRDIKINSGGGPDVNIADAEGGRDIKINSGGGDDFNIADATSGKVNCGGGQDTVRLQDSPDVKVSKNCETIQSTTTTIS